MDILTTRELFACAESDLERNCISEALVKLKLIAQRTDAPEDLLSYLARAYAKLKLFDEAKECFEKYLSHNPDNLTERLQLGMVLGEMGNADQSSVILDDILTISPDFPPALYHKAMLCLDRDDAHSATNIFEQIQVVTEPTNLYHRLSEQVLQTIRDSEHTDA